MLTLPTALRVFAKTGPTDMRKSFEGLVGLVERELGQQVESGHLFLFFNRRGDRVKVLWFSAQPEHTPCGLPFAQMAQTGFTWIIEGDVKSCFDEISHKVILRCVREKVIDNGFLDLLSLLLKAGVEIDGIGVHEACTLARFADTAASHYHAAPEPYRGAIPRPTPRSMALALAGACWGESGIPVEWREGLARLEMIEKALCGLLGSDG